MVHIATEEDISKHKKGPLYLFVSGDDRDGRRYNFNIYGSAAETKSFLISSFSCAVSTHFPPQHIPTTEKLLGSTLWSSNQLVPNDKAKQIQQNSALKSKHFDKKFSYQ